MSSPVATTIKEPLKLALLELTGCTIHNASSYDDIQRDLVVAAPATQYASDISIQTPNATPETSKQANVTSGIDSISASDLNPKVPDQKPQTPRWSNLPFVQSRPNSFLEESLLSSVYTAEEIQEDRQFTLMALTRGPHPRMPTNEETVRWALEQNFDPYYWWREADDIPVESIVKEAMAEIFRIVESDANFYGAVLMGDHSEIGDFEHVHSRYRGLPMRIGGGGSWRPGGDGDHMNIFGTAFQPHSSWPDVVHLNDANQAGGGARSNPGGQGNASGKAMEPLRFNDRNVEILPALLPYRTIPRPAEATVPNRKWRTPAAIAEIDFKLPPPPTSVDTPNYPILNRSASAGTILDTTCGHSVSRVQVDPSLDTTSTDLTFSVKFDATPFPNLRPARRGFYGSRLLDERRHTETDHFKSSSPAPSPLNERPRSKSVPDLRSSMTAEPCKRKGIEKTSLREKVRGKMQKFVESVRKLRKGV
jgi:hypothetical protein